MNIFFTLIDYRFLFWYSSMICAECASQILVLMLGKEKRASNSDMMQPGVNVLTCFLSKWIGNPINEVNRVERRVFWGKIVKAYTYTWTDYTSQNATRLHSPFVAGKRQENARTQWSSEVKGVFFAYAFIKIGKYIHRHKEHDIFLSVLCHWFWLCVY